MPGKESLIDLLYRGATQALLGIIIFLATQIYFKVETLAERLHQVEVRISVIESKK